MKHIITLTTLIAALFLSACGGEKAATSNSSANAPQKLSYEEVKAEHGEEALQELYVDVMAHSTLNFLKGAIEEDVDIMAMTPEERTAYAKKRGAEIGARTAQKISEAVEKNGYTMAEWGQVSYYANTNDWYNKLGERIKTRKAELKAKLEAEASTKLN